MLIMSVSYHFGFDKANILQFAFRLIDGFRKELPKLGECGFFPQSEIVLGAPLRAEIFRKFDSKIFIKF